MSEISHGGGRPGVQHNATNCNITENAGGSAWPNSRPAKELAISDSDRALFLLHAIGSLIRLPQFFFLALLASLAAH